ncbi:hypothetical protein INS49_011708 [Diaporthe citri]|uniref:uncharacterized protein n=1 Tax=Diaporthe citri TaxID=83186 RepID=UPI001C7E242A|nr:uncharacterized protein INS49_011708 [Diaporthe citri]KAG6360643.1 hypothetical protein INS49_011708 [Diaporthe citri]
MSPLPIFFRVPHPQGPVLVRVTARSSTKSRPLDLELRATDDVRAFVLPLQHGKISRYKTEDTTDEEWESCLTSLLLGTQPIANFHVAAQFTDENLGIEIGNRVSGATVIAGTLVLRLSKSGTKNADMFDWANEAVLRQAQLAEELAALKLNHDKLERRVTEETAHFKALERTRTQFESEHDSFFRDLLNEKKLKIRTQEQILSTARVDEAKLAALKAKARSDKSEVASRHPDAVGSSRKGKRKAESAADDTDDDDIDEMDVDEQSVSPGEELSDVEQTTEDEETASEPEPEPKPKSKNPSRSSAGKKAGQGSSPSASKATTKSNKPPSSNLRGKSPVVAADDENEEMPAPRALPFGRKPKPVPDPADDESTASES